MYTHSALFRGRGARDQRVSGGAAFAAYARVPAGMYMHMYARILGMYMHMYTRILLMQILLYVIYLPLSL